MTWGEGRSRINKTIIARAVKEARPHLYEHEVRKAVDSIFATILRSLSSGPGTTVTLPDFAEFRVRKQGKGASVKAEAIGALEERMQIALHLELLEAADDPPEPRA